MRYGSVLWAILIALQVTFWFYPRPETPQSNQVIACYRGGADSQYVTVLLKTEDAGEIRMSIPKVACATR